MVMNAWNNAGMRNVFTENGNNYRGAMAEVAKEMDCPFVDLNIQSHNLFKTTSSSYCSRFFYHSYPVGEYPNYLVLFHFLNWGAKIWIINFYCYICNKIV